MRILVLDDDRDLLKALKMILERHDHEVDCVDNADDALACVAESEYDFALVDYRLPGKSGAWFLQQAALPSRTKALLITAYSHAVVIKEMFDLGVCGYLIKPFGEEDLLRHLEFHAETGASRIGEGVDATPDA